MMEILCDKQTSIVKIQIDSYQKRIAYNQVYMR